jgi:enoyl-[acyl-carrier-protein] reductase (NADH)
VADCGAPPILAGRRGFVVAVSSEDSIGFQCARRLRELGAQVAIGHRPTRTEEAVGLKERCGAQLALSVAVRDEA